MKKIIRIAVIGGTGKSGKYLVNQLLSQGIAFKLLVRNPENFKINNPLIEIVEGDVKDNQTVYRLLAGCRAVISTLGLGQPASGTSIFSEATQNVIRAMKEYHIMRYIVTTGLHVDTPFDKKSPNTKFATDWMYDNYPKITADKQTEYTILSASDTDWTLIRLPIIEQTNQTGQLGINLEDCPGDKVSATDLANFLIGQLRDETYIKKSPFIANL